MPKSKHANVSGGGGPSSINTTIAGSDFLNMNNLLWVYDPQTSRFLDVSFAGNTYLGFTKDDWQQLPLWPDRIHPADRNRIESKRLAIYKNSKKLDAEYRFQSSNSEFRWIRELSGAVTREDGHRLIQGYFFDVSDYHSQRSIVPERENQYRKLVDAMPDAFIIQQDDVIVFANPTAEFLLGSGQANSLISSNVNNIFCDLHHAQARIKTVTSGDQTLCTSNEIVKSLAGKKFDVEVVSCMSIWDSRPAIQSVVRDLSWLSETLGLLREEKTLSKLVLDHIGDGVCVVDKNGAIESINPSASSILGLSEKEMKGRCVHQIIYADCIQATTNTAAENNTCANCKYNDLNQTYEREFNYLREKDQSNLFLSSESNPIYNASGLIGSVFTIRDLTQHKADEAEINKLTRAINQSPIAIVVTDSHGSMSYANQQFCKMTGISLSDFYRKMSPLLCKNVISQKIHKHIWRKLKTGQQWEGEFSIANSNGELIWVRGIISPLKDDNNCVMSFLGMYQDITSQKYAKALQLATESKVQMIFNAIGNAILIISDSGKIEDVNPASLPMFGYQKGEIIGANISQILPNFNINDFKQNGHRNTNSMNNGTDVQAAREITGVHKNGQNIPMLMAVGNLPQPSWHTKERRNQPRRSYICTLQDIRSQKNAQNAIENAQKMDALGQLTGGLAHDFNNLLGIVIGNLDLVEEDLPVDSPIYNFVSTASRAALRGADLTRSLLDFSRSSPIDTETLNANSVIKELETILMPALTARIKYSNSITEDLWNCTLNRSELISALMNLILNARDAMPSGGNINIETNNFVVTKPMPVELGICPPGHYVRISVTDTGEGIDAATLEKIFEPFYTTKPKGKGTGLGLSTVFGFIQRANGFIDVASTPGKGTTFSLIIPRVSGQLTPPTRNKEIEQSLDVVSDEILVVDDEHEIAEFCKLTLKKAGYIVHVATNSIMALYILKMNPDISIMVTDVVMPGEMDGIDLCEEVATINEKIKIVLTTGYTEKLTGQQKLPSNCLELLHKPFRAAELVKAVANVMAQI